MARRTFTTEFKTATDKLVTEQGYTPKKAAPGSRDFKKRWSSLPKNSLEIRIHREKPRGLPRGSQVPGTQGFSERLLRREPAYAQPPEGSAGGTGMSPFLGATLRR